MSYGGPEELSAAFARAVNARDVPAAMQLWSEDAAIVRPDGETVRGHDAIAAALGALVDSGAQVHVEVDDLFTAADVAVASGTLTIAGRGQDGEPWTHSSRSVVIYSRDADGRWRLAIDAPWGLPQG